MNRLPETFTDPLENYDPKSYTDPLERALAEAPVSDVRHQPHARIDPDATVAEAVRQLAQEHVACLLVERNGELLGVFTHREVLDNVALETDQLERPVREVMTADPIFVREDDPVAATLCVMAQHGYRHVPVLGTNNRVVGIVSPQRVTRYLLAKVQGVSGPEG